MAVHIIALMTCRSNKIKSAAIIAEYGLGPIWLTSGQYQGNTNLANNKYLLCSWE